MTAEQLNPEHCYQAILSRDTRFDGVFFVGVKSTGVYCRPVCRVRTPKAVNCHYYNNAASAEQAGFRPCLRCRPELAPGIAQNSVVPNDAVKRLAHQAAAQIKAGALADSSLEALAASLNISDRQLRRAVESEFGVSPIALAQTYRLLLAKQLLTDTELKIIDVAFASGYSSVRRFNDAFRKHYRLSPSDLRKRKTSNPQGEVKLRLSYRPPLAWSTLIYFLSSRSSEGLVCSDGAQFSATLRAGDNHGWFTARNNEKQFCIDVSISPALLPNLSQVIATLRHLFDLDAHPAVIDSHLKKHAVLKKFIKRTPGLRVPGTLNGFELALRAVLGQQVSVKAASTLFKRFVNKFGEKVETPIDGLNVLSPTAQSVAKASLQTLINLGLTQRRAQTISDLAKALSKNQFQLQAHDASQETKNSLQAIAGIGPWTTEYIAMRALSDPDAMPHSDLGLMKGLGVDKPKQVLAATENWRPWRSYGAIHLWNGLSAGG